MAQPGSVVVTLVNVFSASSYQNEWSRATPRSNTGCAGAAHDVGKRTWPSAPAVSSWPSAPPAHSAVARATTDRVTAPFMNASFRDRASIARPLRPIAFARILPQWPATITAIYEAQRTAGIGRDASSGRIYPMRPDSALGAELGRAAVRLQMGQAPQLLERRQHLDRDRRRAQRAVFVDAGIDARRLALADRGAGDGVLGLAVPVQGAGADLG